MRFAEPPQRLQQPRKGKPEHWPTHAIPPAIASRIGVSVFEQQA
jgi:hypothetical protein